MSYKENLDKYFDIDKIVVSKNLSEKEAIAELISIALQKREIQIENNKIVETYIVPYENTGVIPNEEAMANLMALKDSLFDPPNLYDRGITRRISRIFQYIQLDKLPGFECFRHRGNQGFTDASLADLQNTGFLGSKSS